MQQADFEQLKARVSGLGASSSNTTGQPHGEWQHELRQLQQTVAELDRSGFSQAAVRISEICDEYHRNFEVKLSEFELNLQRLIHIVNDLQTEVQYQGQDGFDGLVSDLTEDSEMQQPSATTEPGQPCSRGQGDGGANVATMAYGEALQKQQQGPISTTGSTPPLHPSHTRSTAALHSQHNQHHGQQPVVQQPHVAQPNVQQTHAHGTSTPQAHVQIGGMPQQLNQDPTHQLNLLSGVPVSTVPGVGYGRQGVTPHPLTDVDTPTRSLQLRHSLEPFDLSVFEGSNDSTSGNIFSAHRWVIPKSLGDALNDIDEQQHRLQSADSVKDYIKTYCEPHKRLDIQKFSGERDRFLQWCEQVARNIRDRGQALPNNQAAYITEVLMEKLVTNNIKEVIKSFPEEARKTFRGLVMAMAPTHANTHSAAKYSAKLQNWSWPSCMSYDRIRTQFDHLKIWVNAANSEGGIRVTRLSLHEQLVKTLPEPYKGDLIKVESLAHLWGRSNHMKDPNEMFRWILNCIKDEEEFSVLYQVRDKDKPHGTNAITVKPTTNRTTTNRSASPKPNENNRQAPATSKNNFNVNEWQLKESNKSGELMLVDRHGGQITKPAIQAAQLVDQTTWKCRCPMPNNNQLRTTPECSKCFARRPAQTNKNFAQTHGRTGTSATSASTFSRGRGNGRGRGGRGRGRGNLAHGNTRHDNTASGGGGMGGRGRGNFQPNYPNTNNQQTGNSSQNYSARSRSSPPRQQTGEHPPVNLGSAGTNFSSWSCSRCGWSNSNATNICMKAIYVKGERKGICGTEKQ